MTLDETRSDNPDSGDSLCQSMLLRWRIRCAVEQAALAATARPEAAALCAAVGRTLEHGSSVPDLAVAARTWVADVFSPVEARAALLCLCEVATELSGEVANELRGLDPVLECLVNEAAACSARRINRASMDSLTGCGDRRALNGDLRYAVTAAIASEHDVAVAMVQLVDLAPGSRERPAKRSGKNTNAVDDAVVLSLLAALRRSLGHADGVYRVGKDKFVVLAPTSDVAGVGEVMLLATCAPGPRFTWGAAGLTAAGTKAVENPDVLLVLAEADLQIRRRDFSHANAILTRRRRVSAVASMAAATVLAGGIAIGLDTNSAVLSDQPRVALPAHTRAPARAPSPPSGPSPKSSIPPAPIPSPDANSGSAISGRPSSAAPVPSPGANSDSVNAGQAGSLPSETVSLVAAQLPAPSPSRPPPAPDVPPAGSVTVANKGNSSSAPGHLKAHGNTSKHAQ